MTSIRRRTLGLVLLMFAASMLVIGITSYRDATHEVEELFDARLAQNARLIQGLMQAPLAQEQRAGLLDSLDRALARADNADMNVAGHRYESKLVFQVWQQDQLLLRSARAPQSPLEVHRDGYENAEIGNFEWRIFALTAPSDSTSPGLRVVVAEREDVRGELVTLIALRTLIPDLVGLPVLALLLWWAIGWGLKPLSRMAQQIRERDPHNLQPLMLAPLPQELDTITGALNRLLDQIRNLRTREKRFIADAAHELRTPLAVLGLHAQNARDTTQPDDRRESLDQLQAGVERATRLVSQLLTLARLDPDQDADHPRQRIDLLSETREALAKLSPLAGEASLELQLDADETQDWRLTTEPGCVDTLVQNLVGNALHHSPAGSTVRVALSVEPSTAPHGDPSATHSAPQNTGHSKEHSTDKGADPRHASPHFTLVVDDQGPGIPAAERRKVIERFHRAGPGAGAGLGLSIVDRLVQRHGGELALEGAPQGGLRVRVVLPQEAIPPMPAS
ncbi:two-component system sensor histidine kinase QseC [Onishia taeanensis]|uniref:histidine kinase n=1 Tax=Onishia taeanensis TaxID=284577 RepID=A0A328XPC3_9GAMM|nr:ATP-binding protein [Halomonas taeanensis]RAR57678.1 two-component system sensor histidine kinase QseC [Halomonas taeanensis]